MLKFNTFAARPIGLAVVPMVAAAALCSDGPTHPTPKWIGYVGNWVEREDVSYKRYREAFAKLGPQAAARVRFWHQRISDNDDARRRVDVARAVALKPAVLVASSGSAMIAAAPLASSTTAVVFGTTIDPVQAGVVLSMRASGRPITGSSSADHLDGKRIELLRDAYPSIRRIGVLADRYWPRAFDATFDRIASDTDLVFDFHLADTPSELDLVMSRSAAVLADAWYVPYTYIAYLAEPRIVAHLARLGRPSIFASRRAVDLGAPMSYWQDTSYAYGAMASLSWRIVQGEDPATIPIEQPKRFVLEVRGGSSESGPRIDASVIRRADIVR